VLVNNFTFFENVTSEALQALIRELRERPGKAMAGSSTERKR
jgi:hypothetical protein